MAGERLGIAAQGRARVQEVACFAQQAALVHGWLVSSPDCPDDLVDQNLTALHSGHWLRRVRTWVVSVAGSLRIRLL
ncbi:hypothetical protein [Streptomyces sp. NBC_01439]|uniref:hypothetical protein n=1 Tax=Streptomyces sp. NBC_01439 TaxID=2903867 RepID=UPI002E2BD18E|nr:hypothetical protein [Streptomyces sp. NBC_01439]